MKVYSIYQITNPKGKVYIGMTLNLIQRAYAYRSASCVTQPLIYNSIVKYGWDNHRRKILFTNLTKEEATIKEIELIKLNKNNKISLNIANGGESGNGDHNKKKIVQYDLNEQFIRIWDSIAEAGRSTNLHRKNITDACKRLGACGEFLWSYIEDYNNNNFFISRKKKKRTGNGCSVIQFNLNGEIIKVFKKTVDIEKEGFNALRVSNVISTKSFYHKEFLWIRKIDYDKGERPTIPAKIINNHYIEVYNIKKELLGNYKNLNKAVIEFDCAYSEACKNIKGLTNRVYSRSLKNFLIFKKNEYNN